MSQPLLKLKHDTSNDEGRELPDGFLRIHIPEKYQQKNELMLLEEPQIKVTPVLSLKVEEPTIQEETIIKKKRFRADQYFLAKNHQELFKTGTKYSIDYTAGQKSFAFASSRCEETLHATLLGLAAYFNYHNDIKVTIIVNDLENSKILKRLPSSYSETRSYKSEDLNYEVFCSDGIEIIDLASITNICLKLSKDESLDFFKQLNDCAELILWEIPYRSNSFESVEVNFSMMMQIKSISIVAERLKSTHRDIQGIVNYFSKYGVMIKGVVLGDQKRGLLQ